jgi:hypothetical protein
MVTVVAVRVVKVAFDNVVHVVAVGNRLVPAPGAVPVTRLVAAAVVIGRASARIPIAHGEPVIVDVSLVRMMQVAVVKVVRMTVVLDRRVSTVGPVLMCVRVVDLVLHTNLLRRPLRSVDEPG